MENLTPSTKDHRFLLVLFVCVVFLVVQEAYGGPVKGADMGTKLNRNFCRNHIFSPRCRGQQKRDVSNRLDEYRLPPLEDLPALERSHELTAILNSPTLLGEMLRKVVEVSPEYEESYLK